MCVSNTNKVFKSQPVVNAPTEEKDKMNKDDFHNCLEVLYDSVFRDLVADFVLAGICWFSYRCIYKRT